MEPAEVTNSPEDEMDAADARDEDQFEEAMQRAQYLDPEGGYTNPT